MEFLVLDVSQTHQVGDPNDPANSLTSHGVFVVIKLSILNLGGVPLMFADRDQALVDRAGRVHPASRAADIYGNRGIRSTKIEPGNSLIVRLYFDVPPDTATSSLLARQSSSSTGVTVPIS